MPDSYIGSTNDSYSLRTGSTPVSGSMRGRYTRKFLHLSLSAVVVSYSSNLLQVSCAFIL